MRFSVYLKHLRVNSLNDCNAAGCTAMNTPNSRLEINFIRLLTQCERLATNKHRQNDWRLEKYLGSLQEKLSDLKRSPSRPDDEVLNTYTRKIEFLTGVMTSDKLTSPAEKVMANQLLSPGSDAIKDNKVTKEIHLLTKAKHAQELRDELLNSENNDGVRLRKQIEVEERGDLDAVLKYHNNMQEKLAENMVSLAQSLKQNSLLAGHIIKKDIETLNKTSKSADENLGELAVESDRLQLHSKKSCQLWIWILLVAVCVVFIWMIIFMKMFPKKF